MDKSECRSCCWARAIEAAIEVYAPGVRTIDYVCCYPGLKRYDLSTGNKVGCHYWHERVADGEE